MNILLATPVEKELDRFIKAFSERGYAPERRSCRLPCFGIEPLALTCAAAGHGKAQFALGTRHILDTQGEFSAVVAAGAAGALDPGLRAGDVVIGTESVEHDYKPRFHGIGPPPRHAAASGLVESIMLAVPDGISFDVRTGPIAGGDEDIIDPERARLLNEETGALCVAWEGAGGARAARFSDLPYVELRAVTDSANGTASEDYKANLDAAIGNLAALLLNWLESERPAGRVFS